MEFPPEEWTILEAGDFETAVPRDPGILGVELMAQVRPSGRIVDHFRLVLGGSDILEYQFSAKELYIYQETPDIQLSFAVWPADIKIRRNMMTSCWIDAGELLQANDIVGAGGTGADLTDNLKEFLAAQKDRHVSGAALRWAVGVGPDKRLELSLQALPGSAAVISSKPTLRG